MNLAEFSINKKVITYTLTAVALYVGYLSFNSLPRLEDPEFAIKQALVITSYPGASAAEVEKEVTEVIENSYDDIVAHQYDEDRFDILAGIQNSIPFYSLNESPDPLGSPVTKFWFYTQFQAEGITYEIGDETPRDFIRLKGKLSAQQMMKVLLAAETQ